MKHAVLLFIAMVALLPATAMAEDKFTPRDDLPMEFPNFRLQDLDGNVHELNDWRDAEAVVVFLQGNGCPIVRQSFPYLVEVRNEFEPKGVKFVLINSNAIDDVASIREELDEYGVDILALKDPLQAVAHALESDRTAETFLIDPKTHEIVYRGEADDRFGYGLQRSNPQKFYLIDALNAWLEDRSMPEERIRITKGCLMDLIDLRDDVDFIAEVKPVLSSLCSECANEETCISGWNENQAEMHARMIWEMLLTRQTPEATCGEQRELKISREDAITLMSWLRTHAPTQWEDLGYV